MLLNPSVDGGVALGNYSRPPVISADGTRVAYSTDATRLVAQDTNGVFDAFVREVANHATLLASVGFDGDRRQRRHGHGLDVQERPVRRVHQ